MAYVMKTDSPTNSCKNAGNHDGPEVKSSPRQKSDLGLIASGSAMNLAGAVFGNGLMYLFGVVIGRSAGVETVGLFFLALGAMQFANAVCRIGLPEGLLRFVPIYLSGGDLPRLKGVVVGAVLLALLTTTFAAAALFLSAGTLSIHVFRQPELAQYLRWFAVGLPIVTAVTLLANGLQGLRRPDLVVAVRDLVQPASMFVLLVAVQPWIGSPARFLSSYVGSMLLALGAGVVLIRRTLRRAAGTSPIVFDWKVLLAFSLPIVGSDIAHYALRWSDTFILSLIGTATDVGIYSAALRTTLLLNLLAMSVTALAAPAISEHFHHGRRDEFRLTILTLTRWCLTLTLPIVLGVYFAAREVLALWGHGFESGVPALVILTISQAMFVISSLLGASLLMTGRQYLEVVNTVAVAFCGITGNFLLTPRYGITGTAVSMLLAQLLALIMRSIEVRIILEIRPAPVEWAKPVLALLLTAAAILPFASFAEASLTPDSLARNLAFIVAAFATIALLYSTFLYLLGIERTDVATWREITARKLLSQI